MTTTDDITNWRRARYHLGLSTGYGWCEHTWTKEAKTTWARAKHGHPLGYRWWYCIARRPITLTPDPA